MNEAKNKKILKKLKVIFPELNLTFTVNSLGYVEFISRNSGSLLLIKNKYIAYNSKPSFKRVRKLVNKKYKKITRRADNTEVLLEEIDICLRKLNNVNWGKKYNQKIIFQRSLDFNFFAYINGEVVKYRELFLRTKSSLTLREIINHILKE